MDETLSRDAAPCVTCGADRVGTYIDARVRRFVPHRYSGTRYPARCLASDADVAALENAHAQAAALWSGSASAPERIAAKLNKASRGV